MLQKGQVVLDGDAEDLTLRVNKAYAQWLEARTVWWGRGQGGGTLAWGQCCKWKLG